jgi:cell division protein FtsA
VVVNLSAGQPQSQLINVGATVSGKAIGDEELREVLRYGRRQYQPDGQTIVHAIPTGYSLDGNKGIKDPRGMFGERLTARIHMVSAATAQIRNLALCVERCHLELAGLVVSPYASGLACLVEDEMQLGAMCIDMGGGATSLSIFGDGNCLYADVVALGGAHVTNDIARGLSTPLASAERMKTLYGSALASSTDDREMIDVPQVGEESDHTTANHIPRSLLTGIIQPRLEETFELVRDRLKASGIEDAAGKRIVLTGGASQMTGARELAARMFDKNVRLARPFRLTGAADVAGGPAFSTCAGLLRYALVGPAEAIITDLDSTGSKKRKTSGALKISRWLKMNF